MGNSSAACPDRSFGNLRGGLPVAQRYGYERIRLQAYPLTGVSCSWVRSASGIYGGVAAEDRRAERRRRLLDAGLDLIATEGWASTSVRRVCQRAGLSSRFFYESFDSLDALAVAVVDEIAEETVGGLVRALGSGEDQIERIKAGVAALVTGLTDDPRKARVAFVEALGSEPVMKRRLAIMASVAQVLEAEFNRSYDEVIEDKRFVRLAALGLTGLFVELMIAWTWGQIESTREEMILDITDLVLANIEGTVAFARRRAARA